MKTHLPFRHHVVIPIALAFAMLGGTLVPVEAETPQSKSRPNVNQTVGQSAGQPTPSTSAQVAADNFQSRCSACHSEHGEGSDVGATFGVPDLRSRRIQRDDDRLLRYVISQGRGNMPAFGRDFSDAEVQELIKIVRGFSKELNTNQK